MFVIFMIEIKTEVYFIQCRSKQCFKSFHVDTVWVVFIRFCKVHLKFLELDKRIINKSHCTIRILPFTSSKVTVPC